MDLAPGRQPSLNAYCPVQRLIVQQQRNHAMSFEVPDLDVIAESPEAWLLSAHDAGTA